MTKQGAASSFLDIAAATGVEIIQKDGVTIWQGPVGGKMKAKGPLAGKTIGVLVASEFSDFQAYYVAEYLSEFGGRVEFLPVDWVQWKFTRPSVSNKGVRGMWGLAVDPIPVMAPGGRHWHKPAGQADPKDYQALIVLGGHSADVMMTEDKVIDLIKAAFANGAVVGGVGEGSIPLITAGIMDGKRATGNELVSFMLERIGTFEQVPAVRDGRVVTARNTVDTPAFVRELCRAFDPNFDCRRQGVLAGKKILFIAGEDFEDVELVVPTMEYLYRGAKVTVGTFPPPMRSRPPLLGLDVVMGNFGISVPFQEIPENRYRIARLSEVKLRDFDLVQIPGAFCPWNMLLARSPIEFLKEAHAAGKLIAPMCHGPIPVSAAGLAKGRKLAGWAASKDAVRIMGGTWNGDWSAVIDGQIVSGRAPDDVPEFMDAITTALLSL